MLGTTNRCIFLYPSNDVLAGYLLSDGCQRCAVRDGLLQASKLAEEERLLASPSQCAEDLAAASVAGSENACEKQDAKKFILLNDGHMIPMNLNGSSTWDDSGMISASARRLDDVASSSAVSGASSVHMSDGSRRPHDRTYDTTPTTSADFASRIDGGSIRPLSTNASLACPVCELGGFDSAEQLNIHANSHFQDRYSTD